MYILVLIVVSHHSLKLIKIIGVKMPRRKKVNFWTTKTYKKRVKATFYTKPKIIRFPFVRKDYLNTKDEFTSRELLELEAIKIDLIVELFQTSDKRYAITKALKEAFRLGRKNKK